MDRNLIISAAGAAVVLLQALTAMANEPSTDTVFVSNDHLRVGITLKWGGAVTHVSTADGPNLINSYDLGRQIQQSYYSGPGNYQREGKEKAAHWKNFPWNPIQTGDAFHNGSKVLKHRVVGNTLYVKTVPMLWPMRNDPGACVMETWITLDGDGPRFTYRARLTNARRDKTQYHAYPQEIPAVYTNGPWHRLMTYNGDKPFTGQPAVELRNGHGEPWPWINILATEGWAALLNDEGTGIGVCVGKATEFHGGFAGQRGKGGPRDSPTGYMSPMTREVLDHNIVFEYACRFVLGDLDAIRAEAKRLAEKARPRWTFDKSRAGWTYQNATDAGWPINGKGLTVTATNARRPARLVSPILFRHAVDAAVLKVTISSDKPGEVVAYWRGAPPADVSQRPSKWRQWTQSWWSKDRSRTAALRAGKRVAVAIHLHEAAGYDGPITGIAIDVPSGATVHAVELLPLE